MPIDREAIGHDGGRILTAGAQPQAEAGAPEDESGEDRQCDPGNRDENVLSEQGRSGDRNGSQPRQASRSEMGNSLLEDAAVLKLPVGHSGDAEGQEVDSGAGHDLIRSEGDRRDAENDGHGERTGDPAADTDENIMRPL